jgi:hypothetical protein
MKKRSPKWIQRALQKHKKGALHRQLRISEDKKIPITMLKKAAKSKGIKGRRARLAMTLRRFHS